MAPSVAATEDVSGHGAGLDKKPKVPAQAGSAGDEMLVLNTIRCLAADLCQQVRTLSATGLTCGADGHSTKVDTLVPSWVLLLLVSHYGDIT